MTDNGTRIDAFEAMFDDVSEKPPEHGAIWTVVWSGALGDDPKAEGPALFVNQDLAWEHWSRTAAEFYAALEPKPDEKYRLHWQARPVIYRYQITMMNTGYLQRLVSDRYCVYSVLCVSTIAGGAGEPDVRGNEVHGEGPAAGTDAAAPAGRGRKSRKPATV